MRQVLDGLERSGVPQCAPDLAIAADNFGKA